MSDKTNTASSAETKASMDELIRALFEARGNDIDRMTAQFASLPVFQDAVTSVHEFNPVDFDRLINYPMNTVIEGILRLGLENTHDDNKGLAAFLFMQYTFVDNHLTYLYHQFEGVACCADKSRMVIRSAIQSLMTGDEIVFNHEQEFTFHLPEKIATDHDGVMALLKALYRLYHGRPNDYLKFMLETTRRLAG